MLSGYAARVEITTGSCTLGQGLRRAEPNDAQTVIASDRSGRSCFGWYAPDERELVLVN